ncbi:MAG: hypothetical protein A2172_04715 [Candidatus Woykebacteria bacterium RBG_13_40_15]|uniref:Transglutaminase-like domain-containing protein n=1 Tax=Candidatus Woykebacteria bacterium RBG_13_40_15 TaxID=1802593 RepID=A0A1G1W803_9BACT|nr:MAG: hypothetical protein A2172_04715 [Candidatus Woykebacteria bacterium RBG_13_40_15]
MKRILSICLIFVFSFSVAFPFFSKAFSADCSRPADLFSSSYNIRFDVQTDKSVIVEQKVDLKNLSKECFVSEYSVAVNTTKVKNASGEDSIGPISVKAENKDSSTVLTANLNDEVIGVGKMASFKLGYTIENFVQKNGLIWSVVAPMVVTSEKITDYNLVISAPASLGDVFSVLPSPKSQSKTGDKIILEFGKEVLNGQGILASFGTYQQINFKFKIPLKNSQFLTKNFFIPVPPDTEKQQVLINKIDPKPTKTTMDSLGNYIFQYSVGPGRYQEVNIEGIVRVVGESKQFNPAKVFSSEELYNLKKESEFVQVQDRLIQEKAKELKSPRDIYNFVISHLSYDTNAGKSSKIERTGAKVLLQKGMYASNLDYVDLLTALLRAAGYPTREVFGVAISNDASLKPLFVGKPLRSENLHVWAQFYDSKKKTWLDIDPTWGDTSGADYYGKILPDRFSLFFSDSVVGVDNLKNFSITNQSIKSSYSEKNYNFNPKVDVILNTNHPVSGFPIDLEVVLDNKSGVAITDIQLNLELQKLSLLGDKKVSVGVLLPLEKKIIKIKARGGDIFKSSEAVFKVVLEGSAGGSNLEISKENDIKIASLFSFGPRQAFLISIIVLLVFGVLAPRFLKIRE